MQIKTSALLLCLVFAAGSFECEAAKLTKAQMEELYNKGGIVSTRPSNQLPRSASTAKPKVEAKESPRTSVKTNVATPKQQVVQTKDVSKQNVKTDVQTTKPKVLQTNKVEVQTSAVKIASANVSKTDEKISPSQAEAKKHKKIKHPKVKKEHTKVSKEEKKNDASSWRIKVAQKNLRILGYSEEASTGRLSLATKEALLAFQKKNKLSASGELNEQTYTKLNWEAFTKTGIKNIKGSDVVTKAAKYKGVPYVFGGTSPKGFDCSGYVQYVFKQLGGALTRTADTQAEEGIFITQKQLKPGDLVFFSTYEPGASHVGIYAGNGKFWNASSSKGVILYGLNDDYWRLRYHGARRVLVSNGEIK